MTKLILVVGPDSDDYNIVRASSVKKTYNKLKKLWDIDDENMDALNFIKVDVV